MRYSAAHKCPAMPFGFCVSGGLPALWSSPVEHRMHRSTGRHSTGPAASCQLPLRGSRHTLCAMRLANRVNYTFVYLYRVSYPHTNSGLRALSCVHLAHLVPRLTSLRITFHLFQPLNFLVTYEISMPRFICPSLSVFRVVRSCIPGMAFASQSGTGAFDCSVLPVFAREETTPQTDC